MSDTQGPLSASAPAPALTPPVRRALAWAVLPPLAVLLLRSLLQNLRENEALQALRAAVQVDSAGQALWMASRPFVLALLGMGVAIWAVRWALRRYGWARVGPWLIGLWAALWLLCGGWLLLGYFNQQGRHLLPPVTGTVLLAGEVRPSQRGPGGTELYLQLPGQTDPQRLFVPEQPIARFARGASVALHIHAGRWWGRWAALAPEAAGMSAPAGAGAAAPSSAASASAVARP